MNILSFCIGQHLTLESSEYEVVEILNSQEIILFCKASQSEKSSSRGELMEFYENGQLQLIADDPLKASKPIYSSLLNLTEDQRLKIDKKTDYVLSLSRKCGDMASYKNAKIWREIVALEMEDDNPPSAMTLYRWWRDWFDSGKNVDAFHPKPKTGRKTTYNGDLLNWTQEICEKFYLIKTPETIQNMYNYFRAKYVDKLAYLETDVRIPSRATFYRNVSKYVNPYDKLVAQKGVRTANKAYGISMAGYKSYRIMERAEIDHTPLDIMVFDELTGKTVGRPTLTFILDHYSRMPLGFYCGFEPPSSVSVMRAMRHAILPKGFVNNRFSSIKNSWPTYGLWSTLVCDNGSEFHDRNLKRICHELNIELFYCPKQRPYYKGSVERILGSINRAISHKLPGTTFSDINTRGEYKSVKNASIYLHEMEELIYMWLIDVYIYSPHAALNDSPINVWNEQLKSVDLLLPESIDKLNLTLTKEKVRSLNHEGIQFSRLKYNSTALAEYRRRFNKTVQVHIRIDSENLGCIWVFNEFENQYFRVPAVEFEYAENLSQRQHDETLKHQRRKYVAADTSELLESKVKFMEKLDSMKKSKKLRKRIKAKRLSQNAIDSPNLSIPKLSKSVLTLPKGVQDFDIDMESSDD